MRTLETKGYREGSTRKYTLRRVSSHQIQGCLSEYYRSAQRRIAIAHSHLIGARSPTTGQLASKRTILIGHSEPSYWLDGAPFHFVFVLNARVNDDGSCRPMWVGKGGGWERIWRKVESTVKG